MGGTEFVRETVAGDAVAGLERARRIVKAGMEDAAIAGAGGHAEARELFDEEDVVPAGGELSGSGTADDSAADDEDADAGHEKRISATEAQRHREKEGGE